MKLYVPCRHCLRKIYLASEAKNRPMLANEWGINFVIRCPFCNQQSFYSVNEVFAEKSSQNDSMPVAAVIGGLIGLVGGPGGVIAGGAIGGLFGKIDDDNKDNEVNKFNRSVAYKY